MSQSKIACPLLSLAVAVALSPAIHAAGESDPVTLATVRATAEEETYNAPVSESAKSSLLLRDVPQSISVVTRQMIDDLNMQNIGDAVEYVPGVTMAQGEGNRETPVIRGNNSTGDFFLDGMRDDVQYYRDLYNIQQVEVVRGPNGMLFGRGGVSGLVNRVSKQPDGRDIRNLSLQGGSNSNFRATVDLGQGFNEAVAARLNAMYEDSGSYRDDVTLKRYGVNPTLGVKPGADTTLVFGLEYFHDERVADRGVSSFQGRPLDVDPGTFFGDPDRSPTHATVWMANALIEHRFSDTTVLRNRTRYGDYDKFYQNVFPGAVNASGTMVSISAYNNDTQRQNLFNQTDLYFSTNTGAVRHNLLTGIELGRQDTTNFRETGFFDTLGTNVTSTLVPLSDPRTTLPIAFRQAATDADNDSQATIIALYVQDEIVLSTHWQVIAGLRYDNFSVDMTNNRNGAKFSSDDDLLSPRLAVVYKPLEPLSVYAGYSLTYQPRAGDQLASLNAANESLDPEEFTNYEIGAKWDVLPSLTVTAALFRMERKNIAVADPTAGTPGGPPVGTLMLVDGQRNKGLELGATGSITDRWNVIAQYTFQDGEITKDQPGTTVRAGARLGMLPRNTFSLWNRYDFTPMWGAGLGVVYRDELFAATENLVNTASNVVLPSFTRVDAAVYFTLNRHLRAQLNVENLLDERYFEFAHSNTNVTPASPRAFRVNLMASF